MKKTKAPIYFILGKNNAVQQNHLKQKPKN